MKPKNTDHIELAEYFNHPTSSRQKQYEAVRTVIVDQRPADLVAELGETLTL